MTNSMSLSEDSIQVISVIKETSLGLSLVGGISSTEGPLIYIKDIIPGGDCHKDGRLQPGDQLVSINKESLVGVSCDQAKSILNRAKLRKSPTWEIAFIRSAEAHHNQILTPDGTAAKQGNMDFIPKKSSTPSSVKGNLSNQSDGTRIQVVLAPSDKENFKDPLSAVNQTQSEKNLSLSPDAQFKVEKLEMALNYLGINPTEEQKQSMKQGMKINPSGTVAYGDFVQVAKEVFSLQIKEDDFQPGANLPVNSKIISLLDSSLNQVSPCDLSESDDREKLRKERNEAFAELKKLKEMLLNSEKQSRQLSDELKKVKREAKGAVEEARALRNRIHLAEVAQSQASGMETDYEEVIRLLEAEVTELKAKLSDRSGQTKDNIQDLKKRATVLDCQLRKSEMARKAFEVTTEKLLQFVENVHEVLSDESGSMLNLSERVSPFSPKTLTPRLGPIRHNVTAALASEAKDLSRSIRSIIEVECLPYGWEEAYTADGIKYFINHVTETSSWTHPITALSCLEELEDQQKDLPELQSC